MSGEARESARGSARVVVEVGWGVLVYPPEGAVGVWRATFTENGRRRFRQAVTEAELAVKLEKVTERLAAGAPGLEAPGADLIAWYLDPDRLPADKRWSRKHAHTQARLCQRFAAPVIATVTCQDITAGRMQQIVNAAPAPGEGARVGGMISALVSAGVDGGYLVSPRLARVHWQAAGRPLPPAPVGVAGESGLWVGPDEIPADGDMTRLGRALAAGRHGERDELMAHAAAYSGLRWGGADRADHRAGRPGRPGDHRGPQGRRGRRAPVRREQDYIDASLAHRPAQAVKPARILGMLKRRADSS